MPELNLDPAHLDALIQRQLQQEQMAPQPAPKEDEGVGLLAKILYASGLGADVATTMLGEGKGLTQEANPMLKPLSGIPAAVRSPLVAGAEVGGMMLLNKLIGKKHPKLMKALTMGMGAAHGGAAVYNAGQMKQGARDRDAALAALANRPNTPPSAGLVQQPDGSWINPDYFGK